MENTKGEWKVGHYIVYSDTPSMEFSSLICNTDIGIVSESEKVANAHLISACPEMYEALKVAEARIHNEIRHHPEAGDYREILQDELRQIMHALAKANGE